MENWEQNQEPYNEELDPSSEYYSNAHWSYRELTKFGESPIPISTVLWDQYYETLWVAHQNGRLISYLPNFSLATEEGEIMKYSSMMAGTTPITQLLTNEQGVVALSTNRLAYYARGGLLKASFTNDHTIGLRGVVFSSEDSRDTIIFGGDTHLFVYDLATSRIFKEAHLPFGTAALKQQGTKLCCGHNNGMVTVRDARTFQVEQTLQPHTGGIVSLDLQENLLISTGWTSGLDPGYLDPFVSIYDIRMMKPLPSIQLRTRPYIAKFHPTIPGTVSIVTQSQEYQTIDLSEPNPEANIFEIPGDTLTDFDISSTGQLLVFSDVSGMITVMGDLSHVPQDSQENFTANESSLLLETPDMSAALPKITMDINSPLVMVQLPVDRYDNLLSNWDPTMTFPVPEPPKPVDPSLFADFKQVDFVGYASFPGGRRGHNHYYGMYNRRNRTFSNPTRKLDMVLQQQQSKVKKVIRPAKSYRHLEIKHTKLGIDVFDFKSYNHTCFAGLENILANSYCNPGLQSLYFISGLRSYMLNHLCKKEFCLCCELGFLFHMLDTATGQPTQASNFLRTFRQIPQAAALGLLENPVDDQVSLIRLMENFNRFILEQLHKESISNKIMYAYNPQAPIIEKLFGSNSLSSSKCLSCKHIATRETTSFQYDMISNDSLSTSSSKNSLNESFVGLLKATLIRESHTKAWCEKCARYQLTEQKRTLLSLPNILCINSAAAASKAEKEHDFWKSKSSSWLPLRIRLKVEGNELQIEESKEEEISVNFEDDCEGIYELTTVISHVFDPSKKASKHSHLVTQIKVPPSYHELHNTSAMHDWFLFNDFHITPTTVQEVLDFSFKSPCVLYYTRVDINKRVPKVYIHNLPQDVLFAENPIKLRSLNSGELSFIPLTRESVPKKNDLIAIDAEFVSLGAEETEIRSDGSRAVINPVHFGLARVSLLHGKGRLQYEAFIDDYIVTSEPVIDYLTRYSGIQPGDLDPKVSKHHVTTLKAVYLKLRYLVDCGCVFVGHGLAKDFRIINVLVPPEQIIDTVEIYRLPDQRKISLRFLAYCLLDSNIQLETHDSIEDAKTALELYYKYLDLTRENKFESTLHKLYEIGRQSKWNVTAETPRLLD